jgi:ankyrin repeat protein
MAKSMQDIPLEIRCKIYKHCDTESLFNFGNTHPKYMAEIARCLKNKADLWFKAVEKNDVEWVRMLINAGADLNAKDNDGGMTALHWAAKRGKFDIVKALINAGADLNAQNGCGSTALHWAADYGKLDIVKALINAGANPNIKIYLGLYHLTWPKLDASTRLSHIFLNKKLAVNK